MAIISKILQAGKDLASRTSSLGKRLIFKITPNKAGLPLISSTKPLSSTPRNFSELVRSSPMSIKNAPGIVSLAMGIPGQEVYTQKGGAVEINTGGVTKVIPKPNNPTSTTRYGPGGGQKTTTKTNDTPKYPGGDGPVPDYVGPPIIPGVDTSTISGGETMGWYDELDENLGGLLPGGSKLDYGQLATMAGVALVTKSLSGAGTAGSLYGKVKGLFGGSKRKVYRRRIGVKRSDIKRLKAMSRDLHRLDKVVNAAHIADIKFSRTTKGR